MASPFTSINCAIRYDNARVLTWTLKTGTSLPDNFTLQVQNSRAGGPWNVLQPDVREQCAYVDTRKRNYNKKMDECYRLRLIIPDTNEERVSDVVNAGKFQAYPFSSQAQNVIRQAEKAIQMSGCTGVLLKKKHWGARCPLCTDFDNQQTVNEHCPNCLGTGYEGGYYQGISMDLIKDNIAADEQQGDDAVQGRQTVTARCVAYPWVRYGDVWCQDGTNKRYIIHKVVPTSSYKQTTLIYTLTMHRLEYTDVLYTAVADDRVYIKDVFDSALVNYTPQKMHEYEEDSQDQWQQELQEL